MAQVTVQKQCFSISSLDVDECLACLLTAKNLTVLTLTLQQNLIGFGFFCPILTVVKFAS